LYSNVVVFRSFTLSYARLPFQDFPIVPMKSSSLFHVILFGVQEKNSGDLKSDDRLASATKANKKYYG